VNAARGDPSTALSLRSGLRLRAGAGARVAGVARAIALGLATAVAFSLASTGALVAGGASTSPLHAVYLPLLLKPAYVYLPIVLKTPRPNFLLIITDDQRFDTIDYMPITKAEIFDKGITFRHAFATTPLCCPSRASILTGRYARHTHVYDNGSPLEEPTFVDRLRQAGYYTGIVGKYLNSWDGSYRPEFDSWTVFAGPGASQKYFDPRLNINGVWIQHYGYMTHILQGYALDFLNAARQRNQPWMLIFAPNAPHAPAHPAPGDEGLYLGTPLFWPPSFWEADISDKPFWLRHHFIPLDPAYFDGFRRKQMQTLHSLDLAIGAVLDKLAEYRLDRSTVVIFISDNGVFWGEHRLNDKIYAYDEAARVPFAIRYSPRIPQPVVDTRLVANVDLAPAVYELAGIPLPPDLDGRSPLPPAPGQWRDAILIEGWAGYHPYQALRTDRYLYVETTDDIDELYDLAFDPYQLENQIYNPGYAPVVEELHSRLAAFPRVIPPPGSQILSRLMSVLRLDD